MLDVDAFLAEESKDWIDFRSRFDGLDDRLLTTPGATGDWTPCDVLVHVAFWHRWVSDKLDQLGRGFAKLEPFTEEAIDRLNADFVERFRDWAVSAIFELSRDAHTRAVVSIRATSFRGYDESWERVIRSNTTGHYDEHRPQLDAFLKEHR